jgi:hypothetical protein
LTGIGVNTVRFSPRAFVLGAALFLLGGVAGWVAANRLTSARASLSTLGEAWLFAQMATAQFDNADPEAAKAALNAYLRYLQSEPPGVLDARMISGDKALTLARLALLDERQQNAAEAERLWSEAENEAKAAGWKDPSRTRMREAIERIDSPRQTRKPGS